MNIHDLLMLIGGAAWTITGEDRTKHDAQFFTLKPVNGFVTGWSFYSHTIL